ncbi:MAG: BON domain-containing protein [Fuerstiella sp.]
MQPSTVLRFTALAGLMMLSSSAFAQLNQLGGGNAGGQTNPGAGQAAGAAATGGGTTDGPGGVTTSGPGSSAAQDGGIAGGNRAQGFVGGNNAAGFVGGGGNAQNNSNRQFRALNTTNVPTGGPTQASGTPRQVPVSLRIAFAYPSGAASTQLAGPAGPVMQQVLVAKPELRAVAVNIGPGGVAVLTGQVPDAATARLATNLVRMQPGVRQLQDRLLIAPQ